MKKSNYFAVLDIQRFADPNVQTTTTAAPGNDLTAEMKEFYKTDLIKKMGPNLVHQQFGKKKSIPKNGGKVIEWRKFTRFKKALTPLTEGVTPNGSPMDVGAVKKEVKQYGDYTTLSDMLTLTAVDPLIAEATAQHAENAGITLDTITRNELVQGTQVIFAPCIAEDGSETANIYRCTLDSTARLTSALVKRAATQLKKMNAPKIEGAYVCIIHPSCAEDLTDDKKWVSANEYAGSKNIFEGELGMLHGVRFVESSEAKIWKGDDLSAASRTLTVKSISGKVITLNETITADDANALMGRELCIKGLPYFVTAATTTTVTVDAVPTSGAPVANDVIYPGEGGKDGCATYGPIFFGDGAYGTVDIDGCGAEIIVKPMGSGGSSDPLNQRSTIGWKVNGFGAKIIIPEYIVRVECGSKYSDVDEAN